MKFAASVMASFFLAGCGSLIDRAGDRTDVSVERALHAAETRASALTADMVARAGEEVRKSVDHATESFVAASGQVVRLAGSEASAVVERALHAAETRATALLKAPADRIADAASSRLDDADKAAFERSRRMHGILAALKEFWVEILVGATGTGGFFKMLLDRRRAARSERLAATVVQAVEEKDAKEIKAAVRERIKGTRDEAALEGMIRRFQSRRFNDG